MADQDARVEAAARAIDPLAFVNPRDFTNAKARHSARATATLALAAADAVSRQPAVIVHITDESRVPTEYLVFGDARVFVVDENVMHDRVYEMTNREPWERFAEIIPDDAAIGSQHDDRHAAIAAKVNAHLDGRKHLSVVGAAPLPQEGS